MPTIVHERDIADPPDLAPDDPPVIFERLFKITSPDGTEETYTPDEACDLIASRRVGPACFEAQAHLFGDARYHWWACAQSGWSHPTTTTCPRRFKPRIKLYEVF